MKSWAVPLVLWIALWWAVSVLHRHYRDGSWQSYGAQAVIILAVVGMMAFARREERR